MEGGTSIDDGMSEEMLLQLRQWQQEQKNRLIEQQQQQRQLLIEKQKKLLSMINTCEASTNNSDSVSQNIEPSEMTPAGYYDTPKENRSNQLKTYSNSSPPSVDDVPLKKPRAVRTFQQLLETSMTNRDPTLTTQNITQGKKFPFLKRGQGISRFGVISKPKSDRAYSQKKVGKENQMPPNLALRPLTTVQQKRKSETPPSSPIQSQVHVSHPGSSKPTNLEHLQNTKVSAQVVPFQVPKVDESMRDGNSSRNEEDLAVFELLERFANINASFSSSSSLIGQLIDKGVTHLPSPTKVINFLSKKRTTTFPACPTEDTGVEPERKPGKQNRHVRFAESVEEQPHNKFNEDYEKPWLADISEEINPSQPSPFISNTIRQQSNDPPHQDRFDLDETPTSPIGFPDYQKLFGNPVRPRSLWTNEELPSPTQDECFLKNNCPISNISDSVPEQVKGAEACLPSCIPIEDPRLVYQASLVRSRLTSLEREIANYRRETDAVRRARKEHDESKQKLEQEQEKFKRYAENEKRRLQLLYSEEQKRLRSGQLKDLPHLKENEEELKRLKEELKETREEHRQKENRWMASQTKVQEKIRALELRNRELTENLEKLRTEEQNLRRRLNASLRPGALGKFSKSEKMNPAITDTSSRPHSPQQFPLPVSTEIPLPDGSPRTVLQKNSAKPDDAANHLKKSEENSGVNFSPSGTVSHTLLPDGTKLVLYPNGNRKEIWPDGRGTQVIYYNGDIKQKLADGSVIYTYADSGTKHTTKSDGTDILEFSSGQIETTYPDGRSQVQYPGGAMKMKYPDGREDSQLPDGTKLWTDGKGHGVMTFLSGIREIYTPICKRREYPDGTVKTVYEDGRSETRYANGRIRVKDSSGNIITDTGEVPIPK